LYTLPLSVPPYDQFYAVDYLRSALDLSSLMKLLSSQKYCCEFREAQNAKKNIYICYIYILNAKRQNIIIHISFTLYCVSFYCCLCLLLLLLCLFWHICGSSESRIVQELVRKLINQNYSEKNNNHNNNSNNNNNHNSNNEWPASLAIIIKTSKNVLHNCDRTSDTLQKKLLLLFKKICTLLIDIDLSLNFL